MLKKFNNLSKTVQTLIIVGICGFLGAAIILGCFLFGNKDTDPEPEYQDYFINEIIDGAGEPNEKIETTGYVSYIDKEKAYFVLSADKSDPGNTDIYCYVDTPDIITDFRVGDPVVIKGTYLEKDEEISIKVIYAVCYEQAEVTLTGTITEKTNLHFLFKADDAGYRSIGAIQCLPSGSYQANLVAMLNVGDKVSITGKLTNSKSLTDFSFEVNEISPINE